MDIKSRRIKSLTAVTLETHAEAKALYRCVAPATQYNRVTSPLHRRPGAYLAALWAFRETFGPALDARRREDFPRTITLTRSMLECVGSYFEKTTIVGVKNPADDETAVSRLRLASSSPEATPLVVPEQYKDVAKYVVLTIQNFVASNQ